MPKLKSHKGLLKRVRVTGRGKVKFKKAFGRHLKSVKNGKKTRKLDSPSYVKCADIGRMRAMLHRPVKGYDAADV